MEWLPIVISIAAVSAAFWQAYIAKRQLDQAKQTKNETEKILDEVKEKVFRIEMISDETRKDVKEQVSKLIDKQDENMKLLLKTPAEKSQNEMIGSLLPTLLTNPEQIEALIEIGERFGGNNG